MYIYPEEEKMEKIKRRMKQEQLTVIYYCGCRLQGCSSYAPMCITHREGIQYVNRLLPSGEPCSIDPRYVC